MQAQPKYVIFLIGDGMGFEQVKAAGMYTYGQPGTLSFESFDFRGELTNAPAGAYRIPRRPERRWLPA